jgi:hypothetical protein
MFRLASMLLLGLSVSGCADYWQHAAACRKEAGSDSPPSSFAMFGAIGGAVDDATGAGDARDKWFKIYSDCMYPPKQTTAAAAS